MHFEQNIPKHILSNFFNKSLICNHLAVRNLTRKKLTNHDIKFRTSSRSGADLFLPTRVDQNFLSYSFHVLKTFYQTIPHVQKRVGNLYDKLFSINQKSWCFLTYFLKFFGLSCNRTHVTKTLVNSKLKCPNIGRPCIHKTVLR